MKPAKAFLISDFIMPNYEQREKMNFSMRQNCFKIMIFRSLRRFYTYVGVRIHQKLHPNKPYFHNI